MADTSLELTLKKELTIKVREEEYVFKIPSVKDRLAILSQAVKLRRDSDPDGGGYASNYDPNLVISTETLATFIVLLRRTSAKWVYSPGTDNKPIIDLDQWPDDVPVAEVVDQFNKELDTFRAAGN